MAVAVEALPGGLMDSGSQQSIKGILKSGDTSRQASFASDDSASGDSSPPPPSIKHVRFADHLVSRIIFKTNSTPTQFRTKKRKNKKKNNGGARSRTDSQSDSEPEGARARSRTDSQSSDGEEVVAVEDGEEHRDCDDGLLESLVQVTEVSSEETGGSVVDRDDGDGSRGDQQQQPAGVSKSRRKRNNKRRRRRSGSESDTPREEDTDFAGIATKHHDGYGDGNGVASNISLATSERLKKKGKHTADDGSESGSEDNFALMSSSPSSMPGQSKMKGKRTARSKSVEE